VWEDAASQLALHGVLVIASDNGSDLNLGPGNGICQVK
jgi:hypothetical protein